MQQSNAPWRTPALIIVAGCLIALLTFGVRAGFGLFLEPMSQDQGWGREVFAFAIALQNLLWGLGQPFAGALADRYGSGRVLALGGLFYGLGVWLMAHAATPWQLQLSAGVLVGLGLAGASFAIALAAMSRAVSEERRSWVLGIGTAAGSLGQFLMVPLGQAFLAAYGWSTALTLLGCGVLLVIPLAGVLKGRAVAGGATSATTREQTLGEALREASGHGGYWYLTSGFFVCGFHVAFIATHLPAYLVDNGIAASTAAWALALVGLFNVIGSYSAGVLGGRYSKKYLLSSLYLTRAVVIAVFVLAPLSTVSVYLFAAAMGLLWLSTVPLTSGLVAQIFGPRYMATLFGIVFLSHQLGAFLGVWLGGYLFDNTGSYALVWWISVALGITSAILHWPIDERRVPRLANAAP
ncbi:MAG: MFS transporter [Gammaproteobacteria bacterium]|nr:MFS transporter [Gammaproteobacteria bacterium]MCP5423640.1 MFS transporter [Gammaproteobacteria bacterium]MCP5459893.1 MFS transporter [Gammaproteobacteria bacterium]